MKDIDMVAEKLGISPAMVAAVSKVESRESDFEPVLAANMLMKAMGLNAHLKESPMITIRGVEFEYVENAGGIGKLFYNGLDTFGGNTYTNMAVFDGGAPVKVYDTEGNRSTKANFEVDLKKCFKD